MRGKIAVKLPLILSFSRREKEPNKCRGAHYLPFSSVSASATTPSHLRPGERPATDGGAEYPEASVAAPGTAGMPSLASRKSLDRPSPHFHVRALCGADAR